MVKAKLADRDLQKILQVFVRKSEVVETTCFLTDSRLFLDEYLARWVSGRFSYINDLIRSDLEGLVFVTTDVYPSASTSTEQ